MNQHPVDRDALCLPGTAVATALAALVALLAPAVHAAESSDLAVGGTVRPSACAITLANGGVYDFGSIPARTLVRGDPGGTALPGRQGTVGISCSAPTRFGLSVTDNRAGTLVEELHVEGSGYPAQFGLGAMDGKNIGGYELRIAKDATTDAGSMSRAEGYLSSFDGGRNWTTHDFGVVMAANNTNALKGFSPYGTGTPSHITTLTFTMRVRPAIADANTLDLSADVTLDGSATMTLVYL